MLVPGCCAGLQHLGPVPIKRLVEDRPHTAVPHAKVARDPLHSLTPAALKDAQAERCFRATGKPLAYLSSPTYLFLAGNSSRG